VCGFLARIIVTYAYICFSQRSSQALQLTFSAVENAPLPRIPPGYIQSFGTILDARLLSMLCRSTSELLRTL
jgi:hypothetical protein